MTHEVTPAGREAAAVCYYAKLPGTVHCEIVEQVRSIQAFRIDLSDDEINVVAEAVYNALADTGSHPPQADGDLTAAYLAGSASRNDEVRALQAEADRLREVLRRCTTFAAACADGTGSLFTDAMAELRAIAGEGK